jgi:hypothetical protein
MVAEKKFGRYGVRRFARVIFAVLAALLAAAQAQEEATYTLTGEVLEGPETLPAGYHSFTLQNDGDREAEIVIVQLNEAAAEKDFLKEVQAVDKAFMGEGDPAAAFRTVIEGRTLWGGPAADPGARASVGVDLPAGRYLLLGSLYSEEGPEGGPTINVVKSLEVTGEGAAAPRADATAQLVDFSFVLPSNPEPGEQLWRFVNTGEQVHHVVIQKVKAGKTVDDVMKYAETFEGEDPTEEFAYVHMLSPGSSNDVTLDLTPGSYVALCFIPDYAEGGDGAPHMAHGMMQSFTVAGE